MQRNSKAIIGVIIAIIVIAAGVTVVFDKNLFNHSTASTGNTLIIASSVVPASLDPAVAYDSGSTLFSENMYNTLLGYGTTTFQGQTIGTIQPVPELATSWNVNANGSVVFNLRQNVTFQNGDPFNATCVQFTLDRVIEMAQGPSFHVRQFLNESGIHVLSQYKILLVPSQPYPWFLNLFQLWVTGIVDPNYIAAHGGVTAGAINNYTADHAMGTGPYELSSYSSTEIVMTANPNYWGGTANISKIIYEIVSDPSTQQALLVKGSVNMAMQIPLDQVANLSKDTSISIAHSPTNSEWYIGLSENVTPFNNLSVRKAVMYASNASQILAGSTFGYSVLLQSAMAPTIEGYIPAFQNYTQNITMAKYYLQQASAFLEKNKNNVSYDATTGGFTTDLYYAAGDPVGADIVTILQSQLKAINITVNLHSETSNTFEDTVSAGTYPMFYEGWVNLLGTPDDGLFPLFYGPNQGLKGNYNFVNNTTVTNDLLLAGQTYNITKRDALYAQAQNILANLAVEIPLYNAENIIPVTSNVHGAIAYPTYSYFFFNVTMT